jgi:hypothetical protein
VARIGAEVGASFDERIHQESCNYPDKENVAVVGEIKSGGHWFLAVVEMDRKKQINGFSLLFSP